MKFFASIRRWLDSKKPPYIPVTVTVPSRMPPSIKVEPLQVVLFYRGVPNHVVVRDAYEYGLWCGEHNMATDILTPGDGTIRLCFESTTEELMFRVAFAEKLAQRSDQRTK